jgi:tetratricopeptide (TPR) repeat protein
VKLWDVATGAEQKTLQDHIDAVFAVAFSPDGKRLASASQDRTVKVWDVATGQRLYTLSDASDGLTCLAYSPAGDQIAAAGYGKTIYIWRLGENDGRLVQSLIADEDSILALQWAPDGKTIITSSADGSIRFRDAASLNPVRVIDHQPDWVETLGISPDGKLLAAGRYDGSFSVYGSGTQDASSSAATAPTDSRPRGAVPSSDSSSADGGIEYSDSAALKPGGISGSVDAGGYSSQAQARSSELRQALGQISPGLQGSALAAGGVNAEAAESSSFQRASDLLLGGDYARAANAFRQGSAQFPDSARMVLGLGVAYYSRGLYADAIATLRKAVDLSPAEPQAYFFLAQAYSASPVKSEEVLQRLATYSSSHPGNAAAQYDYALCLWRGRGASDSSSADPQKVEHLLRSAIALDPSFAEAHFQLGVLLAAQGQTQAAASELERAVALEPGWAEAHYRLAQVDRRMGEIAKAQSETEQSEHFRKSGELEDKRLRAEIRRLMAE